MKRLDATHARYATRVPVRNHHSSVAALHVEKHHCIMYIFPSREYPSRYAEHAVTSATATAVRRRKSCTARKYIPGTISVPNVAGNNRTTCGVSASTFPSSQYNS